MMTKVLASEKNKDGLGHLLAITAPQRQKLLDRLDSFGGDTLDWGLKPGQSTLAGSSGRNPRNFGRLHLDLP